MFTKRCLDLKIEPISIKESLNNLSIRQLAKSNDKNNFQSRPNDALDVSRLICTLSLLKFGSSAQHTVGTLKGSQKWQSNSHYSDAKWRLANAHQR